MTARWAAVVAAVVLLAAPAAGYVAPQVLAERSRIGRLIPEEVRRAVQEAADTLTVTDPPAALREALPPPLREGEAGPVLELYGGASVVRRRDDVRRRYDERIALLEEGAELRREYLGEVHYRLRTTAAEGEAGEELPPPAEEAPFLRPLEPPRGGMARARLRRLRDAAAEDLAQVERRLQQAREARSAYREQSLQWSYHLDGLVEQVTRLGDEEVRRLGSTVKRFTAKPAAGE